jgi:hypothetical protein
VRGTEPVGRCGRNGNRDRRKYEPPRIESFGKLPEVIRFNGSVQVDSGGGLGDQPAPFADG